MWRRAGNSAIPPPWWTRRSSRPFAPAVRTERNRLRGRDLPGAERPGRTGRLTTRAGIAEHSAHLDYRDMFALSVLGAIGFTVSLLMAEPARENHPASAQPAGAAVPVTSTAASPAGSALLLRRGRVHRARRDADALEPEQQDRAASGQGEGRPRECHTGR
ncbi:Na+/H+ antiporter NhaA [Nocardia sp. X0981]